MQWSDIQFRPTSKTLRQFAWLWLICFSGLAAWEVLGRDHRTFAVVLGTLALAGGLVGINRPQNVRPIYVAWMVLAFPIGWTMSQVILGLMFYGVFTPIALIFRMIGRDPLHRARQPSLASYWAPKAISADPRSYFRQF